MRRAEGRNQKLFDIALVPKILELAELILLFPVVGPRSFRLRQHTCGPQG